MGRGWDWSDMLAYTVAGYGVVSMDIRGQSGYSLDGGAPVRGQYGPRARLSIRQWMDQSVCIRMSI